MIKYRSLALAFIAVLPVFADQITILNPSFESPDQNGSAGPGATDWTSIGASYTYNPYEFNGGNQWYVGANPTTDPANGGSGFPGISGEQLAYGYEVDQPIGFEQTLTAVLQADGTYTLSIEVGHRNGSYSGGSSQTFAGSLLELLAGDTVIASSTLDSVPAGAFELQTASVDASGLDPSLIGDSLTVLFETTQPGTATDWDNVSLDGPVGGASAAPEPGAWLLLTSALGLLIGRRKPGL